MSETQICGSLDGTTLQSITDEAVRANLAGADFIEVRFDKMYLVQPDLSNFDEEEGEVPSEDDPDVDGTKSLKQLRARLEQIINEGIDKKILFVRFEDLTSNPQKELNRIYNFFKIKSYQHDFKNVKQITQEDDTIFGVFGDHTIRNEVKPVKESYNEILGKELSQNIVDSYPWFYNYFQYL